jgi:hypothetical protein
MESDLDKIGFDPLESKIFFFHFLLLYNFIFQSANCQAQLTKIDLAYNDLFFVVLEVKTLITYVLIFNSHIDIFFY